VSGRGTVLIATIVAAIALVTAATASADPLSFTSPQKLPAFAGGEPSLAFDPNGTGDTYVTAPQGIPTAAGAPLVGGPLKGVGFWGSHDGGHTFPEVVNTGSGTGGGDSDVEVATDHTVFVADLEATAAAICISSDRGKTFPNCQQATTTNQQGPENDREWITRGTKGELYLTYHDFTAGFPIIEKSTDGGQTFAPCGTIIDPSGPAAQTYTPEGGTLVSKPVVGADGTIYVEFTTPDQAASPAGAPLDNLYVGVSPPGGCDGTTTFTDYSIYHDPGADLGKIFQAEAIDGGGNLYVVAAGKTKAGQPNTNLWLFVSRDKGKTWSAPQQINPPNLKSNVLPWVAGGRGGDELLVGWFGSEASGDPNDASNQWRYYAATSFSGGESFEYSTVTPDPIHYQDICTQGILCGLIPGQPGNRNLADFSSVAVNPANGCAAIALPGDPQNNNPKDGSNQTNDFSSSAYVALQSGGTALTPAGGKCTGAAQGGSGGGTGTGGGSTASGPAPTGPGNSVCGDRVEPRSSVSRKSLRATRRRIALSGRTIDRVCDTGTAHSAFHGKVARVTVSVARILSRTRCQFLTAKGRLTPARSCSRPVNIPVRTRFIGGASNKTSWRFSRKVSIRPGRYRISVRGTDAVGHTEHHRRVHNTIEARVR
jgi:hypothetical protein